MNNNFYEKALKLIDSWSVDDLEQKLHKYGIECNRKITLTENDISHGINPNDHIAYLALDFLEFVADNKFAANDNTYAMAA